MGMNVNSQRQEQVTVGEAGPKYASQKQEEVTVGEAGPKYANKEEVKSGSLSGSPSPSKAYSGDPNSVETQPKADTKRKNNASKK